jgi:hypothetical protein
VSDDKEPEQPAGQETGPPVSAHRASGPYAPQTSVNTTVGRTSPRAGQREPAEHRTEKAKRQRGRKVPRSPAQDIHFWVAAILVGGFVGVGFIQAAHGDGAAVFNGLGTAVAGIIGYLYGRSRGCK